MPFPALHDYILHDRSNLHIPYPQKPSATSKQVAYQPCKHSSAQQHAQRSTSPPAAIEEASSLWFLDFETSALNRNACSFLPSFQPTQLDTIIERKSSLSDTEPYTHRPLLLPASTSSYLPEFRSSSAPVDGRLRETKQWRSRRKVKSFDGGLTCRLHIFSNHSISTENSLNPADDNSRSKSADSPVLSDDPCKVPEASTNNKLLSTSHSSLPRPVKRRTSTYIRNVYQRLLANCSDDPARACRLRKGAGPTRIPLPSQLISSARPHGENIALKDSKHRKETSIRPSSGDKFFNDKNQVSSFRGQTPLCNSYAKSTVDYRKNDPPKKHGDCAYLSKSACSTSRSALTICPENINDPLRSSRQPSIALQMGASTPKHTIEPSSASGQGAGISLTWHHQGITMSPDKMQVLNGNDAAFSIPACVEDRCSRKAENQGDEPERLMLEQQADFNGISNQLLSTQTENETWDTSQSAEGSSRSAEEVSLDLFPTPFPRYLSGIAQSGQGLTEGSVQSKGRAFQQPFGLCLSNERSIVERTPVNGKLPSLNSGGEPQHVEPNSNLDTDFKLVCLTSPTDPFVGRTDRCMLDDDDDNNNDEDSPRSDSAQLTLHMPSPLRPHSRLTEKRMLFPPDHHRLCSKSLAEPDALPAVRSLSSMLRIPSASMRASESGDLDASRKQQALLCRHGHQLRKPQPFSAQKIAGGPWSTMIEAIKPSGGCQRCRLESLYTFLNPVRWKKGLRERGRLRESDHCSRGLLEHQITAQGSIPDTASTKAKPMPVSQRGRMQLKELFLNRSRKDALKQYSARLKSASLTKSGEGLTKTRHDFLVWVSRSCFCQMLDGKVDEGGKETLYEPSSQVQALKRLDARFDIE